MPAIVIYALRCGALERRAIFSLALRDRSDKNLVSATDLLHVWLLVTVASHCCYALATCATKGILESRELQATEVV